MRGGWGMGGNGNDYSVSSGNYKTAKHKRNLTSFAVILSLSRYEYQPARSITFKLPWTPSIS